MEEPLQTQIIKEQIWRLEKELGEIPPPRVPKELEESKYLTRTPVNSGPQFLQVHASVWQNRLMANNRRFSCLDRVRDYASSLGYKGITITYGG